MRIAFGILAVVALVHLTGQLAGPTLLAHSTQVLLMPALAGVLLAGTTAPRGRLVHLVLVALLFSWLGDSVPRFTTGDTSFLLLVPYGAFGILIVVLCAPQAGALLPAVAVYAAVIVAMAVLATGLGRLAGTGAVVFVASDALIALDTFGVMTLPGQGFWVMSSYITAQTLLIMAVRHRAQQAPAQAGPVGQGPAEQGPTL